MTFRSLIIALLVLVFADTLFAQLPSTQLSTITPAGGTRGTTVEVIVAGADQDDKQKNPEHTGVHERADTVEVEHAAGDQLSGMNPVME